MAVIWLVAWKGHLPVFMTAGVGSSPARYVMLTSALAMFVLTAVLLWEGNRGRLRRLFSGTPWA